MPIKDLTDLFTALDPAARAASSIYTMKALPGMIQWGEAPRDVVAYAEIKQLQSLKAEIADFWRVGYEPEDLHDLLNLYSTHGDQRAVRVAESIKASELADAMIKEREKIAIYHLSTPGA